MVIWYDTINTIFHICVLFEFGNIIKGIHHEDTSGELQHWWAGILIVLIKKLLA